jgi:hypothetical protein
MPNDRYPKICLDRLVKLDREDNSNKVDFNWFSQLKKLVQEVGLNCLETDLSPSAIANNFADCCKRIHDQWICLDKSACSKIARYSYYTGLRDFNTNLPSFAVKTLLPTKCQKSCYN